MKTFIPAQIVDLIHKTPSHAVQLLIFASPKSPRLTFKQNPHYHNTLPGTIKHHVA